jgi:hypothetical protein
MIFSEIKALMDLLKEFSSTIKAAGNFEPALMEKLQDIQVKVFDAANVEMEMQQENAALRREIEALKDKLKLREMLFDDDLGAYYSTNDEGKREYLCARCLSGQTLCHLQVREEDFYCVACSTTYTTQAQRDHRAASGTAQVNEFINVNSPRW